jgi:uncharacterized protein (TIGR03437 family)
LSLAAAAALAQGPYPPILTDISFPVVSSPLLYGLQDGSPLRSDDSGRTWIPLYVFAAGTAQNISAVTVQPDNPEIVYAITTMDRGGVWKSIDSGRTWNRASNGLPAGSAAVQTFTIAENQPRTLYARVGNQVFRSVDGGLNWTARGNLPAGATALGIATQAPARMFTMIRGGALHRSTDEGATWTRTGGFENNTGRVGRRILIDPSDLQTVYVSTEVETTTGNCTSPGAGLLQSRDGGATLNMVWESGFCNVAAIPFLDRQRPFVHLGTGFFGSGYCRSRDRGGRFDCFDRPRPMAIDSRNGDILFASSGRSISRDGGDSFETLESTVRPTLPAYPEPIVLEIEEGGQGQSTQTFATPESASYRVPFNASVTQGAWLSLPAPSGNTATGFRLNFSAQGLAPGTYNATLRLESAEAANSPSNIPFLLRVNPRVASGLRFVYSEAARNLDGPRHLQLDAAGNIYFYALTGARIQRIDSAGRVTDVLGTGVRGNSADGTARAQVQLPFLNGFAMDAQGNPYWSESDSVRTIRNGLLATVLSPSNTFGIGNFPTRFGTPRGVAFDAQGRLYVPSTPGIVRRNTTGLVELFYSHSGQGGTFFPSDLAIAPDGTLYLADNLAHRVYRLRQGQLTTIAGTGTAGYNGDSRAANTAQLNRPVAVDIDRDGVIYIADSSNNRIRAVTPDGSIFTVAGGAPDFTGNVEGADSRSVRITANDVLVEPDGSLLVADTGRILRFRRVRGQRPAIVSQSMTNAGGFSQTLAPGALFALFGSSLAASETISSTAPWPGQIGGVSVLINGRAAPLYYVGPNQINGQIPYETPAGPATVQVRSAGGVSDTVTFEVASRAPAMLVFGDNRAVAVNPDGSVNTQDTPAPPESVIVVYFTGLGQVDNAVPTGTGAAGDPLSRPTAPVRAFVGDAEAEVLFAGLAPAFVGLAQGNFKLPPLEPSTYELRIAVGEAVSAGARITVGQ